MSLLVIGTIAYDTVETPYDSRDEALGGSATYFAIAASNFTDVRMVGVVGTDFHGEHLAALKSRGIETTGIEVANGKTFRWGGRYEADWNTRHTTFTDLNVFETFDPKVPASQTDSKFLFLANGHPNIQMKALEQIENSRFTVADTMNLWIDIARDELLALLKKVDGVVLNDEEARMLTGTQNLIQAAHDVRKLGPRYVILKKGEHGAFLIGEDVHFSLPAYPVTDVVDPTGAGDAFAGGFMGHLASCGEVTPGNLRQAMLYGTVTASYCVQGFSIDQLGEATKADFEARHAELQSIVTI
ncbi:MAG: sugar/nucleoside kinase (ribokinase family) [Planctomycetota bacterium]|jgi:sugar/nucleoside kinase (ribokinase family)